MQSHPALVDYDCAFPLCIDRVPGVWCKDRLAPATPPWGAWASADSVISSKRCYSPMSSAIVPRTAPAWTCRSSTISAANTSGSGRLALSFRLSSCSQKMSRLTLVVGHQLVKRKGPPPLLWMISDQVALRSCRFSGWEHATNSSRSAWVSLPLLEAEVAIRAQVVDPQLLLLHGFSLAGLRSKKSTLALTPWA